MEFFIFIIFSLAWGIISLRVCYTDINIRTIYNKDVLVVFVLTIATIFMYQASINFIAPIATLLIGMFLVNFNIIGGGDIKLLAAVIFCIPNSMVMFFLLLVSIFGVPLAIYEIILRKIRKNEVSRGVPYGVAIVCGYSFFIIELLTRRPFI